ncbi:hypothetical protein M758_UG003000 [Ceratodon purpureus]|nr:hypothetical protein M758_UG003000 [Ceratodon purpureus]
MMKRREVTPTLQRYAVKNPNRATTCTALRGCCKTPQTRWKSCSVESSLRAAFVAPKRSMGVVKMSRLQLAPQRRRPPPAFRRHHAPFKVYFKSKLSSLEVSTFHEDFHII